MKNSKRIYTACAVSSHLDRDTRLEITGLPVEPASELTWIDESALRIIGVRPEKKNLLFSLPDGRTVSRDVGFALFYVEDRLTADEVVFAESGDGEFVGWRTLDGLGLVVDPDKQRLIESGPRPAAALA